ncbi:MAG: multicomponent Na+:H+ antiporter subunit D [Pseudohongiellaceae bacterium]|jgi:multicomponent Na+:H+ antiporter subunit D
MTPWFSPLIHPFFLFFVAAVVVIILPNKKDKLASIITVIVPLVSFVSLLQLQHGSFGIYYLLDLELTLLKVDRLSLLFGYLFHLAAFIASIYAFHINDRVQQVAALLYTGSALGAVFAGDWITLFIFWELLALTSVFLILARRTRESFLSSMRYLVMQVLSGVLLFSGALMIASHSGTASITALVLNTDIFNINASYDVAIWLIFLAYGIKCGFPLLHNWIVDAYPQATPTGTLFLISLTTKVAVYALARSFAGTDLLIIIGLVMACFPLIFAVIENDLRRVLAYCLINQIGFMVCAIGIGTEMAINGAVATAFNHVLYKGLLMMSLGAVLYRVGHVDGSHLGGLYKSMPKTTVFCIVGALSSSFPLLCGFVSKAIIMLEMLNAGHTVGWLLLLFAAAGVFLQIAIKIPFLAFFARDSGLRVKEAPANMLIAMSVSAIFCIAIGIFPSYLYSILPYPINYSPYDLTHVVTQLQLLFFSTLAFIWLNRKQLYPAQLRSTNIDSDWFYRKLFPFIWKFAGAYTSRAMQYFLDISTKALGLSVTILAKYSRPDAALGRGWGINTMLMWLLSALIFVLLFNYMQ